MVLIASELADDADRTLLIDRATLLADPNQPATLRLEAVLAQDLHTIMARYPGRARATELDRPGDRP